jgi:hypothetical protein
LTKETEKAALEKQRLGKTLTCSCGNSGFIMTDVQGSEVTRGFRKTDDGIVCQACGARQTNSN